MMIRVIIAAAVVILTACSTPSPPGASDRTAGASGAGGPASATGTGARNGAGIGATPASPARAAFEIGDVSPTELAVSGGQLASQILSVSYAIPDPSTVVKAELKLYVSEMGDLATRPVDPLTNGVLHLAVEPRPHHLGAHVQFRAHCAAGVTDWYSLGQIPFDYQARMAPQFRISSVTPQSIPWSPAMDPNQSAAGTRVRIFGPQLGPDCRIEAQADGAPIDLNNVFFHDGYYEGLLLNRDIGHTSVAPRYAELKLVITRASGQRIQAVKRVPFAD